MGLRVGVDVGKKVDPTAIVVIETAERERPPLLHIVQPTQRPDERGNVVSDRTPTMVVETVYVARFIERLPLNTSYPEVATYICNLLIRLRDRRAETPELIVDATGVGAPVVDILRKGIVVPHRLMPVYLTNTNVMTRQIVGGYRQYNVGKVFLVSRLQALIQTRRVKLPNTAESKALQGELTNFEIRAINAQHDASGAFKSGTHDDLVIALGLALLEESGGHIAQSIDTVTDRNRRLDGWV